MLLYEKEIIVPAIKGHNNLLWYLKDQIKKNLDPQEVPVRFVITQSDQYNYKCEVGVLTDLDGGCNVDPNTIFFFQKRDHESINHFNVVLLVPTGIGAEIGGHAGDASAVARLVATSCDNLITHPNVVNASDINELPENGLYVEGSIITRLLMGSIGLQKVRSNRLILLLDKHQDKFFNDSAINSISAARATFGLDCKNVLILEDNIPMKATYSSSGRAVGSIERLERLYSILEEYRSTYDAIGISSLIDVPRGYHHQYFSSEDMLNPWGGVEAMLTHSISTVFNVPSAHSPMLEDEEILNTEWGVVDPRKSAEAVSLTFLHCILKGLHRSPKIVVDKGLFNCSDILSAANISCLIIPYGCLGIPTIAAIEQGIPVIAVKENRNKMKNNLTSLPFQPGKLIVVENYLEAVGVINAMKAGVSLEAIRRPLPYTNVVEVPSQNITIQDSKKSSEKLRIN